jgi:hypothetical protein
MRNAQLVCAKAQTIGRDAKSKKLDPVLIAGREE